MIKDNISQLNQDIALICAKIHQQPDQIKILAVSKGRPIEEIKETIEAGITDIGENRVQEALTKYNAIPACRQAGAQRIKWHMIGHLQTNKVKDAVKIFDLIHSVDSLHLAEEIDIQAARMNKVQDILIEVNTSGEKQKYGFKPNEVIGAVRTIALLKHISLKGLMTIAPLADSPEKTRPYFRQLRELLNEINAIPACPAGRRNTQYAIRILSMGMTDDFQIAIEEGATIVRLGRAIYGESGN
jgi:pyridoxal phosphate enzyme (YggS family)